MPAPREVYFFKDYFLRFYREQTEEAKKKVKWELKLLRELDFIPEEHLKHIEKGIYEVRITSHGNIFRIFCCFDEGNIIVLFNGFQKKTNQTPRREIEKALRIHREYREAKAKSEIDDILRRSP
jgi:phage-related protein